MAIAIPNLLASKRAANQSAAVSGLRTVASAESVYRASVSPNTYDTLANVAANGQLDTSWTTAATSAGGHDGYVFSQIVAPTADTFGFIAAPASYGNSGKNLYCVTEAGSIHVFDGSAGPPTPPTDEAGCMAAPVLGQ